MKLKLAFLGIFVATQVLHARTTFEQILNNNPVLDWSYAVKVSETIDEYADMYKVPANVLAGIAMQESAYKLEAINFKSNDYCMFQINSYNIKAYKFDQKKLLTNMDYCINAGAKIFEWFYRRYELKEAIKRYNCGTRKHCINWSGPQYYLKKVLQYM